MNRTDSPAIPNAKPKGSRESGSWTPGPWEANLADADEQENISIEAQGSFIATVFNAEEFPCLEDDERPAVDVMARATAHLIKAAPALYAALAAIRCHTCGWLYGAVKEDTTPCGNSDCAAAEAALAKARGEA